MAIEEETKMTAIDCETNGKNCIIQLAAVSKNHLGVIKKFNRYFLPIGEITEEARQLHGLGLFELIQLKAKHMTKKDL